VHVAEAVTHDVPGGAVDLGRGTEAVIVASGWIVGQLVFFRAQWLSGFDRVMGDPGAARFIIYVNENWYQSLLGHASWRNPAFYHPIKNTLGLSDTFLLWQIVYTPMRALGADPFLAYQLVLVASSALGFVTFYLLVRTLWHPPIALGLLGAAVFAFSNALYANANHPQLFGVLLVPSVCLLGVAAWRAAVAHRTTGILWGAAFGALSVLVIYSTYYVGFFALLAAVIAGILALLVAPRATAASVAEVVRRGWKALLGVVLGAVLPALLFAVTFLPALHAAGGYKLRSASFFAPTLADLVNVGFGNLVWGATLVQGAVHGVAAQSERDYAVTPILLVLSVLAAVLATVREHRDAAPAGGRRYSSAVLATTGVVLLFLPVAIGGTFLWRVVYWIPGASGIRAVDRISVVASAVLVLALVDASTRLAPWLRGALSRPALVVAFVVLAGVAASSRSSTPSPHLVPAARASSSRPSAHPPRTRRGPRRRPCCSAPASGSPPSTARAARSRRVGSSSSRCRAPSTSATSATGSRSTTSPARCVRSTSTRTGGPRSDRRACRRGDRAPCDVATPPRRHDEARAPSPPALARQRTRPRATIVSIVRRPMGSRNSSRPTAVQRTQGGPSRRP
jgi:hypothetical protein